MQIFTARQFNQDTTRAKRVASGEPVFVTDRGRPTHVLMSIDVYRQLSGDFSSIVDLLGAPPNSAPLVSPETVRSLGGRAGGG